MNHQGSRVTWRVCLGVLLLALAFLILWNQRQSLEWGSVPDYATAVAVVIAVVGLDGWRRQLRGTHDFELARRMLLALYEVRDGVRGVRNPFMDAAEAGEDADPDSWQIGAYQARWDRVQEPQRRLRAAQLEAEAVWGDGFDKPIQDLNKHITRLFLATRHFIQSRQSGPRRAELFTEADDHVLYGIGDDEYDQELVRLVGQIEAIVRPRLGSS